MTMNVGDPCATCGAEVFNYNSAAVGCKRGHRYDRATGYALSVDRVDAPSVAYVAPAPAVDPVPALKRPVFSLSGAVAGAVTVALIELVGRLLG